MTKNTHPGYRSSTSGEFVTKQYAVKHPSTTQKESVPNPGRGDTKSSSTKSSSSSSSGTKKK